MSTPARSKPKPPPMQSVIKGGWRFHTAVQPTRASTEATILRGTLKMALMTLQAASGARSDEARKLLVEDAVVGLRIGLDLAREEKEHG